MPSIRPAPIAWTPTGGDWDVVFPRWPVGWRGSRGPRQPRTIRSDRLPAPRLRDVDDLLVVAAVRRAVTEILAQGRDGAASAGSDMGSASAIGGGFRMSAHRSDTFDSPA